MWQGISVFTIAIIFAIGVTMIVLPIFPVMVYKSQWLYKKYGHELEEDKSYKKIYDQGVTRTGKVILIIGFFLLIIASAWLLFIV